MQIWRRTYSRMRVESVIFLMFSLKRENIEKEREVIADMADRIEAIQRSMNIRVAEGELFQGIADKIKYVRWRLNLSVLP